MAFNGSGTTVNAPTTGAQEPFIEDRGREFVNEEDVVAVLAARIHRSTVVLTH